MNIVQVNRQLKAPETQVAAKVAWQLGPQGRVQLRFQGYDTRTLVIQGFGQMLTHGVARWHGGQLLATALNRQSSAGYGLAPSADNGKNKDSCDNLFFQKAK